MISHFALPTSTRRCLPEILVSGPEMIPSRGPVEAPFAANPKSDAVRDTAVEPLSGSQQHCCIYCSVAGALWQQLKGKRSAVLEAQGRQPRLRHASAAFVAPSTTLIITTTVRITSHREIASPAFPPRIIDPSAPWKLTSTYFIHSCQPRGRATSQGRRHGASPSICSGCRCRLLIHLSLPQPVRTGRSTRRTSPTMKLRRRRSHLSRTSKLPSSSGCAIPRKLT